jgi:hypothetical protein
MKNLYLFFSVALFSACGVKDKVVENQTENLIMQAVTSGQWQVTGYTTGSTDQTPDFSGYSFQFKKNYTVDAINNGSIVKTGTWNAAGNAQAQTMTSNFTNANNPLPLLNGTWNILNTTWTSVEASQTVNGELRNLKLTKL